MEWSELSGYTIGNVDTSGDLPDETCANGVVKLPLFAPDSNSTLTFVRDVYIDAGDVVEILDTPPSVYSAEEIMARYVDAPMSEQ